MLLPATASGPQADFRRRGSALPGSARCRPPAQERFDHPWLVALPTVGSLRGFGFVRLPRAGPNVAMPDPPDLDFVIDLDTRAKPSVQHSQHLKSLSPRQPCPRFVSAHPSGLRRSDRHHLAWRDSRDVLLCIGIPGRHNDQHDRERLKLQQRLTLCCERDYVVGLSLKRTR
jgi:hypothetical protein